MTLTNSLFVAFLVFYLIDRYAQIIHNFIDIVVNIYDRLFPLKVGSIIEHSIHEKEEKYRVTAKEFSEYKVQVINPKPATGTNRKYYVTEIDRVHARRYYKLSEISKFNDDLKKLLK